VDQEDKAPSIHILMLEDSVMDAFTVFCLYVEKVETSLRIQLVKS